MHKLLTVDDLVKFCETQNFQHFNSADSGYQICVQIPAQFDSSSANDETMFYGNVLVMHTGGNRNRSNLTESAAKKSIKSLAYKPVLANFCEIDGVRDFTSHDFEINEDGSYTYFEKQVGCFTADKAYLEQDPDRSDRLNVFAKIAIPREYTDAADIIERKGGTKCSVELGVNELSYDSKNKELILEDVDVLGLTLLGKNPETGEDIQEGMQGAHVQIEDFAVEQNSVTFNAQIINSIADAVAERLSDNNNQRKEEPVEMKDEKNVNAVTEEAEVTEETTEEETLIVDTEASDEAEEVAEETPEVVEEFTNEENEEDTSEESEDFSEESAEEDAAEEADEPTISYSVNINGVTKTFSVSLREKLNALSALVNETYGEADYAWYDVDVFEDDKIVEMHDWWNDKHYRQGYTVKKDVYSLKGDRVQVYARFLTDDQIKQLDSMKADYALVTEKLSKYESEPEKMTILNSDDYANIADMAEFVELKKEENHFDMSVEEVKAEADRQLLAYAKGNKIEFSANEEKKSVGVKHFGNSDKGNKRGRYGNLFKK